MTTATTTQNKDKELAEKFKLISESHIGVMPLPDTIWSRSKCGFKLIQYMACRL